MDLRRVRLDERGQAILEYAMIVALVGACLVAILGLVGRATRNAYARTGEVVGRQTGSYAGYGGGGSGSVGGIRVVPAGNPGQPDSAGGGEPPDSVSAQAVRSR